MIQILAVVLAAAPLQEPEPLVVSGTVWVVEQGERRLPFDGTLQLCYGMFYGTESVSAELVAGTLRCELPPENAGTYRITVPAIEGYLPVEPREVQARRREVTEVVFQLTRAR